jgi:hypothetical protein
MLWRSTSIPVNKHKLLWERVVNLILCMKEATSVCCQKPWQSPRVRHPESESNTMFNCIALQGARGSLAQWGTEQVQHLTVSSCSPMGPVTSCRPREPRYTHSFLAASSRCHCLKRRAVRKCPVCACPGGCVETSLLLTCHQLLQLRNSLNVPKNGAQPSSLVVAWHVGQCPRATVPHMHRNSKWDLRGGRCPNDRLCLRLGRAASICSELGGQLLEEALYPCGVSAHVTFAQAALRSHVHDAARSPVLSDPDDEVVLEAH